MKLKNILVLIVIGVILFLVLDIQQIINTIQQYMIPDKEVLIQEGTPIVPGKPCIIPGGTAYYYPDPHRAGYVILEINKINEMPSQALVKIQAIRTIKPFKYHHVRYYPGEKLWLPSEQLHCSVK